MGKFITSPTDVYMGAVSCVGLAVGSVSNLLVLAHLTTKHRARGLGSVPTRDILVFLISLVDLVISLLHITTGVSLLSDTGIEFETRWYCLVWGFVWNVTIRLAAVYMFMLAADLVLYMRSGVAVLVALAYCGFQVVQATVPFWKRRSYKYNMFVEQCTWQTVFRTSSDKFVVMYVFTVILEFLLPNFVSLICVITDTALRWSRHSKHQQLGSESTEMTDASSDCAGTPGKQPFSRLQSLNQSESPLTGAPPAVLYTSFTTRRATVRAMVVVYCLLSIPQIGTSILELLLTQHSYLINYLFDNFPPQIATVKMYAVGMYSMSVVLRAWVSPVLYCLMERRSIGVTITRWCSCSQPYN